MQSLQKFKQTELGMIPEGWEIKKLSDVGRITGGGTPDTNKKDHWENGKIAWAVPTDLTSLKTNYIDKTERYITQKGLDNSAAKLLPEDTILITSRATIGECAITTIPITTNQGFQNLICNSENNNLFLLYVIKFNKEKLLRKSHGTTFLEISKNNIKNLKLSIPPLKEQQKIASILSNVDELIQKTEHIIEQTQRLKKGLMQKLLTKGIGHTKFKNTKFGEIPEEWEAKTLVDICNTVRDGSHFSPKHQDMGFPLATVTNMKDNYIDIDSCYKISKEDYHLLVKNGCKLESGDVLFSKDGTVGLSLVYNQNKTLVVLSSIAIIRPKKEILNPYFTKYVLQSEVILGRILGARTGTALRRIILKDLRKITIPIPQLKEQQKIISILSNFDLSLENYNNYKLKIENLKKGLMQQLLTGKIRVKV